MIISPKIRGFICTNAHPEGCAAHVREQIHFVQQQPAIKGAKNVLIIGSSAGYGLASQIVATFGCRAKSLGVFFERPGTEKRTATAGYYNAAALEEEAMKQGLTAKSLNGDAFSHTTKQEAIDIIKNELDGRIDLCIYSLASPRRNEPDTGKTFSSVLKTTGTTYTNKTLNTNKGTVEEISIGAATPEEIEATIKVMGGEDWQLWINALQKADVLAEGFLTLAYSYIGPELTWPIYKEGSIGMAKAHLQSTADALNKKLATSCHGKAFISVNKALVTQASSAIPVVPLYISILYKIMKKYGVHEGCIEQIYRLFAQYLYNQPTQVDNTGAIRIDNWEMREDIQAEVAHIWQSITTDSLEQQADFAGYQKDFLRLFGFGIDGVDYQKESNLLYAPPSLTIKG